MKLISRRAMDIVPTAMQIKLYATVVTKTIDRARRRDRVKGVVGRSNETFEIRRVEDLTIRFGIVPNVYTT